MLFVFSSPEAQNELGSEKDLRTEFANAHFVGVCTCTGHNMPLLGGSHGGGLGLPRDARVFTAFVCHHLCKVGEGFGW